MCQDTSSSLAISGSARIVCLSLQEIQVIYHSTCINKHSPPVLYFNWCHSELQIGQLVSTAGDFFHLWEMTRARSYWGTVRCIWCSDQRCIRYAWLIASRAIIQHRRNEGKWTAGVSSATVLYTSTFEFRPHCYLNCTLPALSRYLQRHVPSIDDNWRGFSLRTPPPALAPRYTLLARPSQT